MRRAAAPLRSLRIALLALLTQAAAFTTPSHDELCRAQAAPGCLQILKEIHLERIVEDRGAPYAANESAEAYLEHLNATVGARARIGLGEAHAEAAARGYKLALPGGRSATRAPSTCGATFLLRRRSSWSTTASSSAT